MTPTTPDSRALLTLGQVAEETGFSVATVRRWCMKGVWTPSGTVRLQSRKFGPYRVSARRIRRAWLEEFIEALEGVEYAGPELAAQIRALDERAKAANG